MTPRARASVSGVVAVALMVAALWAWQQSVHLSIDADQPKAMLWAVRTAALSAAALAQAILLLAVVGNIYAARPIDVVLRIVTSALFLLAGVAAVALGMAAH